MTASSNIQGEERDDRGRVVLAVVVSVLAALFCFYNLDGRSISRADESLYARSVQEMLQSGSWIPTLHGSPFLHKPPLIQLLTSLSVSLFGDATWAYRIPSALSGFLYLVLVPVFAHRLFNSSAVSFLSFLAILSCKMLFSSHLIREAAPDGLLVLFLLLGLMLGWELWNELMQSRTHTKRARVLGVLFGISLFIALCAKSVAGLMSLIILWIWMLGYKDRVLRPLGRSVSLSVVTTVLPIVVFIAGYVAILRAVPGTFGAAVHYEVIEKLLGEGHHNTTLPYYYFSQLFIHGRAFPALVLSFALLFGVLKAARGDTRCAYLSLSIFAPLLGYSFLHSRLYWYIAPVFAPCAVLIGVFLDWCIRVARDDGQGRSKRYGVGFAAAVTTVLLGWHIVSVVTGQLAKDQNMALEVKIRELVEGATTDSSQRIIQLCIDPTDRYFKSLLLREWFYLDMLKPFAVSVCDSVQLQEALSVVGPKTVVTARHLESLLPQTTRVLERSEIRVDRFRGISKPDRVRELVFLRIE
jgi:4-amino-4-deoxy-L-arabinose transferase-like glycosyltransferase